MEAGARLLSPAPPPKQARTHIRNPSFGSGRRQFLLLFATPCSCFGFESCFFLLLCTHLLPIRPLFAPDSLSNCDAAARVHDQAVRTIRSVPAASVVRPFLASTLSRDQQDDRRASLNKDESRATATLFKQLTDVGSSQNKEKEEYDFDRHQRRSEDQLLCRSGLLDPFPSFHCKEKSLPAMSIEQADNSKSIGQDKRMQSANGTNFMTPVDVLALATRATMASREATSLAENSNILAAQFLESHSPGLNYDGSTEEAVIEEKVNVRSKRLSKRQSKKLKSLIHGDTRSAAEINKKINRSLGSNDPLRSFLWGPETKQLLTDLMRLEEVQQRLQVQLNREPTLAEWAQSVGMSCDCLRSSISSGRRSRDKMIYANFRLVVHLARQYEGKGLEFQDLLQEGSRGLMKSLEKFKPKAGCRFPTYSYWWIRQSIRKAIFQNSRIIRLPDNIYAFLKEIKYATRLCIQEGQLPTNEEIAKRVGVTVKKLEKLLLYFRDPVSIQEHAWQNVTFQEIIADLGVEIPDLIVTKQLMRQHVRDILKTLKPRERKIIQYRFGMHENKPKTLREIGDIYDLSNERVRQLESRALNKLKEWCLTTQGLKAYRDLLV
ncbi:RNA polymerase sigma factor [Musa troglodytarum]|uniref:RNA polymerase sigma factor n=1 Tax=Musa troglodytarum TaxID=320322 RepID=A0A9E7JWN6_9LILI|nr:RNA polymerase sigma factor [Musa troglodytarum]